MIDSLVFYRECLKWAYFLGKEPFDAFEHVACVFIMTSTCGTPVVLWQVVDWNLTATLACVASGLSFPFGGGGGIFRRPFGEQGMAQGRERSPPTNVARVQIPASTPYVGMWVEFVAGFLLCSERFFSGHSGFPLSSKINISKIQFDQESGRRRTTMWMCYLQIVIYWFMYLFIYLFIYESSWHS